MMPLNCIWCCLMWQRRQLRVLARHGYWAKWVRSMVGHNTMWWHFRLGQNCYFEKFWFHRQIAFITCENWNIEDKQFNYSQLSHTTKYSSSLPQEKPIPTASKSFVFVKWNRLIPPTVACHPSRKSILVCVCVTIEIVRFESRLFCCIVLGPFWRWLLFISTKAIRSSNEKQRIS